MKIFLVFCFISSLLFTNGIKAQNTDFSKDPDVFIQELQTLFENSRNADAITTANNFGVIWKDGSLSSEHKNAFITLFQEMNNKNFKVNPHLENFISAITFATQKNISSTNISGFLTVTHSVVANYENQNIYNYLATTKDFFQYGTLYHSSYNNLYASSGSFSFDYIEEAIEVKEEISNENAEDTALVSDDGWFSDWDAESTDNTDWGSSWEKDEEVVKEDSEDFIAELTRVEQPAIRGPVIVFEGVDLTFKTNFDSTGIKSTKGSFMPMNNIFVGNGGKFDWSGAGLGADSVYCEFEDYNFKVNKIYLSAENTKLNYFGKLDKPVEGVFEFQSHKHHTPAEARYPRFKSYNSNINVKNLGNENLRYKGGFALAGKEIYSSSVVEGIATIEVSNPGDKKFIAKSDRFNLKDSLITAQRASIVIYQNQDSLYHPSVQLRFNTQNEHLTLLKDEGGFKNTPFFASYFQMDVFSDMIKWNLNSDSLDISILNAKSQLPAVFESHEYFNEFRFNSLTGLYSFHPLQMVIGYSRKIKSEEFYSADMANAMNQKPPTVKGAMIYLMQNGLIDYDPKTDLIKLKDKGKHSVLAKAERKDFDNLSINSISPSKPNATLYFKEQNLKVRGINKFFISEALEVTIQPENHEITLLSNRDFVFDGMVNAGNFEYIGKNFRFDYDSFLIRLSVIDSIKFYVNTEKKDRDNKIIKKKLDNQLVQTSGTLYINKPDNKSAKQVFPKYPYLTADQGATVFFDGKEVIDGSYDREVYFSVPPFEIDSLNSSNPNSITFPGTFVSGGIFPDIEASVRVMPDKSLGFEYKTPASGIPLYGDKGTLYSDITMDNRGIRSNGKIEHLNATLYSDDFLFYKDSTVTVGTELDFKEGDAANSSFPDASLKGYKMKWLPQKDSMFLSNTNEPFQFYHNTATLSGTTIVTSNGIFGKGKIATRGSEMISRNYTFEQNEFSSRHANFRITTSNKKKPVLTGLDIRLHFDLNENVASIIPEKEGVAALDFPYAQIRTSIKKAIWNLNDKTIHMSKPDEVPISQSYFYTTRKDLDSLAFNATGAVYDIEKLKINVSGIPYIKVADAKITPENNEVLILENAELQQFKNAIVVIDTANEFHRLINGNIKILSRKKFEGDATYEYVNTLADTFAIKFESFKLLEAPISKKETRFYTVSSGEVSEKENLLLSPGMLYKGKLTMFADKEALELDGFVKLDLKKTDSKTWINYTSQSEVQEIIIDFDKSLTEKNEPLHAGLHIDSNTNDLYGTFLSEPQTIGDEEFFRPSGFLSFDNVKKEYKIENPEKVQGKSYAGKIFTYNEETSDIKFEGPFTFIKNQSKFTLKSAGKGRGNLDSREYVFNTFMVYDFDVPIQAMDIMGFDISDVAERVSAPSAHTDRTSLLYKVAEIIGDRAAKEYEKLSLVDYTALVNASPELAKSIVLSDVDLKWSEQNKAWYSTSKISVSNILKTDINARLDGFLEIKKTEGGGESVNLFIQASPGTWYYISYEDNKMLLFSSNDEFNGLISAKSNAGKAKIGDFVFAPGDIAETLTFINEFRKTYFDIDAPYQLDVPTESFFEDDPFKTIEDDDSDNPAETSGDDSDGF